MAKSRVLVVDPLEAAKVGGITPEPDPLDLLDAVEPPAPAPPVPVAPAPKRVPVYRLLADVRVNVNGQMTTLRKGRVVSDACVPNYMRALHEAKAQLEEITE